MLGKHIVPDVCDSFANCNTFDLFSYRVPRRRYARPWAVVSERICFSAPLNVQGLQPFVKSPRAALATCSSEYLRAFLAEFLMLPVGGVFALELLSVCICPRSRVGRSALNICHLFAICVKCF